MLAPDGVHLGRIGITVFARNFIRHLRGFPLVKPHSPLASRPTSYETSPTTTQKRDDYHDLAPIISNTHRPHGQSNPPVSKHQDFHHQQWKARYKRYDPWNAKHHATTRQTHPPCHTPLSSLPSQEAEWQRYPVDESCGRRVLLNNPNCSDSIQDPVSINGEQFGNFKHIKGLKVAHLNVRSLAPKIEHLRILLTEHKIDVFAISETWLHDDIDDSEMFIAGYTLVRKDSTGKDNHGGVACFISNTISFKVMEEIISDLECCWIKINLKRTKPLILGIVYFPKKKVDFLNQLRNDVSKLNASSCETSLINLTVLKLKIFAVSFG